MIEKVNLTKKFGGLTAVDGVTLLVEEVFGGPYAAPLLLAGVVMVVLGVLWK